MPRYFFHVREETELSRDWEGQELPNLEAARREATNSAREMIAERMLHGGSVDDRVIEITDSEERVLARVDSAEVLFREGRYRTYRDDVTKSAPVTIPIASKPSPE